MSQQTLSNLKQSSSTKFSNYVSVSNNLSPIPNAYQKAYKKYKDGRNVANQESNIDNTQFNSMNSFNGLHNPLSNNLEHKTIMMHSN